MLRLHRIEGSRKSRKNVTKRQNMTKESERAMPLKGKARQVDTLAQMASVFQAMATPKIWTDTSSYNVAWAAAQDVSKERHGWRQTDRPRQTHVLQVKHSTRGSA